MGFLDNISQPQVITIGVLALIAVPVLGVGLTEVFGIKTFQLAGSQLCVDGVSDVHLDSTGSDYEGGTWTISTSSGCNDLIIGGGGEIDEEEIEDGDLRAESGFEAGMKSFQAWFSQEIDQTSSTPVYKIETKALECNEGYLPGCNGDDEDNIDDWLANSDKKEYNNKKKWVSDLWGLAGNNYYYATRAKKVGEIHSFSPNTETDFEATMALSADGKYDDATITKSNPTVVLNSGGQEAQVTFQGSLLGKIRNVDYDQHIKPVETDNGQLRLTSTDSIENYNEELRNIGSCLDQAVKDSSKEHEDKVAACQIDSQANQVLSDERSKAESALTFPADITIENGDVRTYSDDPNMIERPSLRWEIDAGWIGVNRMRPEPVITGVQDFTIEEGSRVAVQIPVQNKGETGRIQTDVTCDGPLSGDSVTQTVTSGDSQRFEIGVSATEGQGRGYECTVEASAYDDPTLNDASTFQVQLVEDFNDVDNPDNNPGDDPVGDGDVVTPPDGGDNTNLAPIIAILAALGILGFIYNQRQRIKQVLNL